MPSVFSHPSVPLAISVGLGRNTIPRSLLWLGVAASVIPDVDVVSWWLGIPFGSPWGHRGFTHSLCFAALLALACCGLWQYGRQHPLRVFSFIFIAAASHGLLDACNLRGNGVMLLWPFSDELWHSPWRFIAISPLDPSHLTNGRWLHIMLSEWLYLWLPAAVLAASLILLRRVAAAWQR